jgi:hypothetical protein
MQVRLRAHYNELDFGRHSSPRLQNSWDQNGRNAFVRGIIEVLPGTVEDLRPAELFWIDAVGRYNALRQPYAAGKPRTTNRRRNARELRLERAKKRNNPHVIRPPRERSRPDRPEFAKKISGILKGRKFPTPTSCVICRKEFKTVGAAITHFQYKHEHYEPRAFTNEHLKNLALANERRGDSYGVSCIGCRHTFDHRTPAIQHWRGSKCRSGQPITG